MSAWTGSRHTPGSERHKAAQKPQTALDVALDLAAQGWPVFPCGANKKPAIAEEQGGHGFLDAVTDPDKVRALFARAPHAKLVGVPTGARTGLLAIDVDPRNQGDIWEAENTDQFPVSRMHSTQGGGRHRIFQYVEGIRGRKGCPARGVDVRADGGYIIMPPSTGYAVADPAPIAPCPAWLLEKIRHAPPPERPASFVRTDPDKITDKRLDGIVRSLLARISNAAEGLKHETLRDTSRALGGYAHLLPYSEAQLIALAVGALPDTVEDWENARKTAAWGIAEGRKRPLPLEDRPYHPNGNGKATPDVGDFSHANKNGGDKTSPPDARGTRFGRLLVLSVDDADTATTRDYLLKGLISPGEVSIWVGPPKCGKSFLMLHIAYMLSLGRSVFGRRVKPTKVLYIAAEGEAGIANRIRALRNKYGPSANFHFTAQPADLLHDAGHKDDLIAAARALGAQLIVLDTLSRLMAGGDENSPIDMGCFVRNVADIRQASGAHIAIVHHGTKASNGSNPRGHSCLTGADDALIEVLKLDDGSRVATVAHAKDDADGMRWGFALDVVELGRDEDGDPITTLLVSEKAEPPPPGQQRSLSDNLQIGLRTLRAAMKAHGILASVGEDCAQRQVVAEADWRTWFYREGKPGEPQDTKKKAFQRIVTGLQAKELIGSQDGYIWPI